MCRAFLPPVPPCSLHLQRRGDWLLGEKPDAGRSKQGPRLRLSKHGGAADPPEGAALAAAAAIPSPFCQRAERVGTRICLHVCILSLSARMELS